ncbi:MAG: M23 family metallopeptidase [Myxococcales bacterium]
MDDATSFRITLITQEIVWGMLALGTFVRGWRRGRDRRDRASFAALALACSTFGAVVARWDVFAITLRPVLLGTVALGAILLVALPPRMTNTTPLTLAFWGRLTLTGALLSVVASALDKGALPEAVAMEFPLKDGRFYVVQGGASLLLNYHRVNVSQKYALDITSIGPSNRRAEGVLPSEPRRYFIFGASVLAPCSGRLRYVVDSLPASGIPSGDVREPAGNYVAIDCTGTETTVVMAHLQQGSVRGRTGQDVTAGQLLGLSGQSGHSSEPHLHIHAARDVDERGSGGTGIPMTFAGRFLAKNDVFASAARLPPAR